jgi:hypothetical protein
MSEQICCATKRYWRCCAANYRFDRLQYRGAGKPEVAADAEATNYPIVQNTMWEWLMSLDAPTRAALIGGAATVLSVFGALVGVYANLAWNRKQHRDEKSYSLRRDVYLELIGTIYRELVRLGEGLVLKEGKLPDLNGSAVTQQLYAAFAKVQVLGERRVIVAVMAFEEIYNELSRNLSNQRNALKAVLERAENFPNEAKTPIKKLLDKDVNAKITERDAAPQGDLESRIGIVPAEGAKAPQDDESELLKQVNQAVKEANDLLESMSRLLDEFFQQVADVLAYILEIAKKSGPALHELIVAMKSDLGVRIDEEWYKGEMEAMLERSIRASKESSDRLHKDLRAKYAEIQQARVTVTVRAKATK